MLDVQHDNQIAEGRLRGRVRRQIDYLYNLEASKV